MDSAIAANGVGPSSGQADERSRRLVTLASLIGTTVEWYDFFLYGTITGLVFNKQFFPSDDAFVSTALAYTVYAVGFVTRPVGGHVLWVELPPHIDSIELHRRALTAKISIAPGPIFSAKQKFTNFIRLNCGNPWSETIENAVMKLGQILAAMK